jgi:choline dehydrogenase
MSPRFIALGMGFLIGGVVFYPAASTGAGISKSGVLGKRSTRERPLPDLFCLALLGLFKGYFPGYSALFPTHLNYLTILKAHTNNRAGKVTPGSADPRDTPEVNFRYFDEGSDRSGEHLDSVVEGIKFMRKMTADLKKQKTDCRGGAARRRGPVRSRGFCAQ